MYDFLIININNNYTIQHHKTSDIIEAFDIIPNEVNKSKISILRKINLVFTYNASTDNFAKFIKINHEIKYLCRELNNIKSNDQSIKLDNISCFSLYGCYYEQAIYKVKQLLKLKKFSMFSINDFKYKEIQYGNYGVIYFYF